MYTQRGRRARPDEPVGRVMSWPVSTVLSEDSLTDVAETLAADEIGAVLVLHDGQLAGIVSERDVVQHVAASARLSHLTAGEVMSQDLVTVQVDEPIVDVARAMRDAEVRHAPVLDDDLIAGIVSVRDLLGVLAD